MDLREIDYLVGREIMGLDFSQIPDRHDFYWDGAMIEVPHYSSKIEAAWKVFVHFGFQGCVSYSGDECYCEIMCGFDENGHGTYCEAKADTAPLAICLAALRAHGIDVEGGEGNG